MTLKVLLVIVVCVVLVNGDDDESTTARPRRVSPTPTGTTEKYTTEAVTPASPTEKNISIALSGSGIPTKDQMTQVDAFVQVYAVDGEGTEERLGSTEVIENNENPVWLNVFWLLWSPGTGQKLKFILKDFDRFTVHDEIGEVTMAVDEYMNRSTVLSDPNAPALDIAVPVSNDAGTLRIRRVYPKTFGLYARNLPHLDTFDGHSDPFVEIYWKAGKKGERHLIGTTAVINNHDHPNFPETFEFSNYRPGSYQYMVFKVMDSDSITSHDEIGEVEIEADTVFHSFEKKVVNLRLQKSSNATLTIFFRKFYTPGVTFA